MATFRRISGESRGLGERHAGVGRLRAVLSGADPPIYEPPASALFARGGSRSNPRNAATPACLDICRLATPFVDSDGGRTVAEYQYRPQHLSFAGYSWDNVGRYTTIG